jgi:hypothetical protein
MRNLLLILSFEIPPAVAGFHVQQVVAALIFGAFFILMYKLLSESQKSSDAILRATDQADAQLREEVVEAQKIAFSKLANADEQLKTRAAEMLADAAKYLGYPYLGGRTVYPNKYVLLWKKEGLVAVAQARQLLNGYAPE